MRTKIICTIGPSCSDGEQLQKLVDLGVSCVRVNLSHGTPEEKAKYFERIRSIKLPSGLQPSVLADLAGPKIRVKKLKKPFNIEKGQNIQISNEMSGNSVIQVSKGVRFQKVNKGAKILIDDGRVTLEVVKHISNSTLLCKVLEDGLIENKKGVNFPGVALDLPTLTEQDIKDLKLSLRKGADWIALSFVRSPEDYDFVRKKINDFGYNVPIMAKIEKWEAVDKMSEIIDVFDGVMVARGDLGVELPLEKVPLIQNDVVEKANRSGKPVVIATQILDSMTHRPVPTRAEVSDIANAILDGADALMVTGETAIGKHPQKVIKLLGRVIKETESSINYKNFFNHIDHVNTNTSQAIGSAACSVAADREIKTLVTMTHSGSTARMISRYRPSAKIIAMTPFKTICRQLAIVWGVNPILVKEYISSDEIPDIVNAALADNALLEKGVKYVITGGIPVGVSGTTNYLSVLKRD